MVNASLLLLIGTPLLAALACWRVRTRRHLEAINLSAFACMAGLAAVVIQKVHAGGTIEAFDGFLRVDALSAIVLGITAFVILACGIYAVGFLRADARSGRLNERQTHRYYVLTPILCGAMIAVPLVNNLGVLWVAVESTTLASVLLVRLYNQKSSLEAAWKFIMIGSAAIALALFGTVFTYFSAVPVLGGHAGDGFNWSVLAGVAAGCDPAAMKLAFVMVLVGYGTKAGLAPMHTWKPDAYAEAPVPSAALLGAGFINCAIYAIMRFYVLAAKCLGHEYVGNLLVLFGVASITVAAPFVLTQRNMRRLLAYSSIDHAGIIVAAVGFGGRLGALGALLHMLFHGVTKPLMFFCAGNVQQHFGTPYLRRVTGVVQTLPWTGGLFLLATVAVTGVPPFSMFQSEFIALSAAFVAHRPWAAALFLLGIVTIFSGFLVHMSKLCLGVPAPGAERGRECPWKLAAMVAVAVLMVLVSVALPRAIYHLVDEAAVILGAAL